ncbi:MAG: hypothetical protein ACK5O2_13675 [Microthrixaceae bacterium]
MTPRRRQKLRIQPEEVIADKEPDDLTTLDMPALRSWREHLQEVEYGFSYARRVTQGRLDTIIAELERRNAGDTDTDVVDAMPEALGNHISGPGLPRPTRDLEPPDWADSLVAELDEFIGPAQMGALHEVDVATLTTAARRTSTLEHEISEARASLHGRIDRVQAELIERYRDGAAVDDLLN